MPEEGVNTFPCQHEIELIYAAYGYGIISQSSLSTFGTQRILTGLTTSPSGVSIDAGARDTVIVTGKRFARQGGEPTEPGSPTLSWVPEPVLALEIEPLTTSGSQVEVFGDPGTHTAYAKATGGTSARIGQWMARVGHPVPVTITGTTPPPPETPLRVVSIGITGGTPVTVAGIKSLTAFVTVGDGTPVTVRWQISYSDGRMGPFDFEDDTWTSVTVTKGSYTISVKATPKQSYQWGYPMQQDIPVCTGSSGGGGNLRSVPDDGYTPNAVEGC